MEQLSRNLTYLVKQSTKAAGEIAKDLGIKNQSNLSNWCKGYAKPGLDDFVAILKYFKVTADDLLFFDMQATGSLVSEPRANYSKPNNDVHLELLIESYEIRIKSAEDLNATLSTNNLKLKTSYDNLQSALKANYIKEKSVKKVIKK